MLLPNVPFVPGLDPGLSKHFSFAPVTKRQPPFDRLRANGD
jgi:hypothetical protein